MFNFLKKKQTLIEVPNAGEVWYLRLSPDGSPWPPRRVGIGATVLAVQDGWVRFDLNFPFIDQRMKVADFVRKYRK